MKGILVVADSKDNPKKTFKEIVKYVLKANGFNAPKYPLGMSTPETNHPPFSVLLIPGEEKSGGLETICVEELINQFPWISDCVESYLACDKIDALKWSAEKRDKARVQCLIAALNEKDPNKSLSNIFSASTPIIDVKSKTFDLIEENIMVFCEKVGIV